MAWAATTVPAVGRASRKRMSAPASQPDSRRPRWYRSTPGRLLVGLLLVEALLWLSEYFCWFQFNEYKGWTVLIAVECATVTMLLMLIWWAASLLLGRQFRFSRHTFLILVFAIALPGAWLAAELARARVQYRVAERLRAIKPSPGNHVWPGGGKYRYESKDIEIPVLGELLTEHPFFAAPRKTKMLRWLEDTLGKSFFLDVAEVYLDFTEVTDADLAQIEELRHLQCLDLRVTKITDAGLERLRGLTHLRGLWLDGTQVTDAGLSNLNRMNNLTALSLQFTAQITDTGLEHLKALAQLKRLLLCGTHVTDAGVARLQQALPNCKIEWSPPTPPAR